MAENTIFGSYGRLPQGASDVERTFNTKTNGLNYSVSRLEKGFDQLATDLTKILGIISKVSGIGGYNGQHVGPTVTTQSSQPTPNGGYTPGSPVSGEWNNGFWTSPTGATAPTPTQTSAQNGGNVTFNGVGSGGSGSGSGGFFGGYDPQHRAPTNPMSGATRFAGAGLVATGAYAAGHSSNQYLEQTIASQYAYGNNWSPTANAMFNNRYTAVSTQDAAQANLVMSTTSGFTPTSPGYQQEMAGAGAISYIDPSISLAQSSQATESFRTPGVFNKLLGFGINPINKQGNVDVQQIAQQVLAKLPWTKQIKDPAEIAAELYNPAGGIALTLQSMMASGLIPGQAYKSVVTAIYGILLAQIKGINPNQFQSLTEGAQSGNGLDQLALTKLGLGNSLVQTSKNKGAVTRNIEVDTLGGFTAATKDATNAITGLKGVIDQILQIPGVGGTLGAVEGVVGSIPFIGHPLSGLIGVLGSTVGAGGSAPTMSQGTYKASSSSVVIGAGGSAPSMSRGGVPAQRQSAGSATSPSGGGGSSGTGGAGSTGISFIPPGPGLNDLDSETDFGPRNIGQGFHTGIDLMRGMMGATFKASADGTVVGAGWGASGDAGYGNTVMIDHGGGYVTMYAHASAISVSKGASVRQGQGIGAVGDTGSYSMGPHLHFELHINGHPVDPVPYLSGKKGSYTGSPPASGAGSSGQTTTAQGTGAAMGSTGAFANGDKYGSIEEVDALAGLIAGMAPAPTSSSSTTQSTSSGASSGSGSGSSGSVGSLPSGTGQTSVSAVQAYAKSLLGRFGWGADQFTPLVELWNRESGWNYKATNPSSGAYGIPQSLPADKMASAGPDWRTNPDTQIRWGLNYIKDRYGSPAGAWGHETSAGWYRSGKWRVPSDQLANIHQDEMVLDAPLAHAVRSVLSSGSSAGTEGAKIVFEQGAIVVQTSGNTTPADAKNLGRQIVDAMVEDKRMKKLASGALYG